MTRRSERRRTRRAILRAGLAAGTIAVAGCNSGGSADGDEPGADDADDSGDADAESPSPTAEPTDAGGATETDAPTTTAGEDDVTETPAGPVVAFEDDFEDGDYTSDPAWDFSTVTTEDTEVSTAEVVSRSSPDGSMGLHLTDMTNDRYPAPTPFELADPMTGVDGAWTLSGLFSPVEIPEVVDRRYNAVHFYWPPDANFGNRAVVEFQFSRLDAGRPGLQLRTQPQENREWETTDGDAADVETGQWYRWELVHDGAGGYVGRRWPADGARSDGSEIETAFEAPGESVSFDLRVLSTVTTDNGAAADDPGERAYTVDHDFLRRTPE
jgi:hypothetical protein